MKRSDMVTYLHNLLNTYPGGTNFDRAQVDEILEGLENMGMLPPKVNVEHKQRLQDPATKEYGDFVSWTYKSVWEDESKQSDKIMPSALTEEEVKKLIENDEDLKRE